MEIACSGFIYGLTVASSLIRSGVYRRVMLIGRETLSKLVESRRSRHRDALRRRRGRGGARSLGRRFVSGSELGSDGSRPEILRVEARRIAHAAHARKRLNRKADRIHMEGREVFKFAVTKMIAATDKALEKART